MKSKDYKDFSEAPKEVKVATAMAAANAVHLAMLLARENYPGVSRAL